jgi:phosphinothricin acetyltransferase
MVLNNKVRFRPLLACDWNLVAKIYKQGIDTNLATFQTEVPDWDCWHKSHLKQARIVAIIGDEIVGWAALLPVSSRYCYRGVAEVSIYISTDHLGQKIGSQLFDELIAQSEKHGIWTLQSSVFAENTASIKLHHRFGFRQLGIRENIAQHHGLWRSTVILERRSKINGLAELPE